MSSRVHLEFADPTGGLEAERRSRRANRRRLVVFASVFLVVAIVGLIYVFARPAVYESTARLAFVQGAHPATDDATKAGDKPYALRDEVQYLTSRTLLARVWADIEPSPTTPAALRTADPPATLQSMLSANQVAGTDIVFVQARGPEPAFLPVFVDRVVALYRSGLAERYESGSATAAAEAANEAQTLDADVASKRREVDAFRATHNIVSLERDENQVLSEVKGVGVSLNAANEKLVVAEARLGALKAAEAAGQSATRAKDDPTLAALEQEAARIRADLRETSRTFTDEYMNIDPRVRSLRARLADIDEQIGTQRQASRQNALQDAREEVAGARAGVAALRQQLAANQSSVQAFTSRLNEYRALQDQLAHLEQLRQKSADRLTVLEAGERVRMPKVDVVEAAATPQSPSSPAYGRDAALAVLAALLVGLVAMGIVELFNRPPHRPGTVVIPQAWGPAADDSRRVALPSTTYAAELPDATPKAALSAPLPLPRELTTAELDGLLKATDGSLRAALALLLMGLTRNEVVGLRHRDVDRDAGAIHLSGAGERVVALPAPAMAWLPAVSDTADAPLLSASDLDSALLYAAHDAGIDEADEVTPEALRHTYIAFLARQGVRFVELARVVGPLPADRLAAYKALSSGTPTAIDGIERILPVLRGGPR